MNRNQIKHTISQTHFLHLIIYVLLRFFLPLVWGCYARRTAFHWEHVDSSFSCGEEATETQEGANCHRWCCPAILQRQKSKVIIKDIQLSYFSQDISTYVTVLIFTHSLTYACMNNYVNRLPTRQCTIQMFLWSCLSHRCMFLHTL